MFKDASQLLQESPSARYVWRVADFRWEGFQPRLFLRDLESGEVSEHLSDDLAWMISEDRLCPGPREEGLPPCPDEADPGRFNRCRACDRMPVQECIFEPRCAGDSCPEAPCGDPHVVYISFFGADPKVGMTRAERLQARGIEQGADAIMAVISCSNRLEARREEKRLSAAMGVRQSVSSRDFAKLLVNTPPYSAIREVASQMLQNNDLEDHGLIILDGYPMPRLERVPTPMPLPGWHRGKILGWKGRHMAYRDRLGNPKIIDARGLPGRRLGKGPQRTGQTTLF